MVRRFDFGGVNLSASSGLDRGLPREDAPFIIALLGDFSGAGSRDEIRGEAAARAVIPVDRDNLDEVLARIAPALGLPMGGAQPLSLRFRQLEDFHPDRLFDNVEIFRRLREIRLRLQDPATFAGAAEELGLGAPPQRAAQGGAAASADSVAANLIEQRTGSLLDAIVERSDDNSQALPSHRPDLLQEFVRRVTEPHLVRGADAWQADVLRVSDEALSAQMRALLHAPAFQALEASWRALDFLARRMETSSRLKLCLIDISKEELCADVLSTDVNQTQTYKLLVEKTVGTPGAEALALLIGNCTFGAVRDDAEALGCLAKIAQAAGAPFLAAGSPRLLGCTSLAESPHPRDWKIPLQPKAAEAWDSLRRSPEAAWIGLALPRFLLRLPYGKDTDPIESFSFEEMPGEPAHEDYLWGNPAFACALLLAESFSEDGWEMRPGTYTEIDGLPLHVYKHDGESKLQPCAEALLTEDTAEKIMECGLMPIVSLKGRDAVKLVRLQSTANPPQALMGQWNQ